MKERIKQLMDSQHMNQQVFAEFIGLSPATLSSIISGRTKLTVNTIVAIRNKFPTINVDWLLFGTGSMFLDDKSGTLNQSSTPSTSPKEAMIDFGEAEVTKQPKPSMSATSNRAQSAMVNQPNIVPKIVDKPVRKITEIMVFYDDRTVETFVPKK